MPNTELRTASRGYFRAAGIPLLRGREFTASDPIGDCAAMAIINQTLADERFPSKDPIGKRIAGTGEPFTPLSAD